MLRRWLERWARGVVLGKRLPAEFGSTPIYVSPDARLSYFFRSVGRTDSRLLGWATELVRPGEIVWDIGSNCGVFSMAAALRAGCDGAVLAMEPDPFLAQLLRRSAGGLGDSDAAIEILQAAAAERTGRGTLNIASRGRAANWLEGSRPS